MLVSCTCVRSVDETDVGHIELSLRLSHVDPKAARLQYKALAKGKWKEEKELKKREKKGKVSELAAEKGGVEEEEDGSDNDSVVSDDGTEESAESDGEVMLQQRSSRLDVGAFQWNFADSDRDEELVEEGSDGEGQGTTKVSGRVWWMWRVPACDAYVPPVPGISHKRRKSAHQFTGSGYCWFTVSC